MFQKGILHQWILGKGAGSTRDTECLVWGSGSLLSMVSPPGVSQKAVSSSVGPWGIDNVPVSRPRGAPGRWQAGIFQAEAQLLPLLLHGAYMELQPVSPCLQDLGIPQSYPSDKVGIDLEPS